MVKQGCLWLFGLTLVLGLGINGMAEEMKTGAATDKAACADTKTCPPAKAAAPAAVAPAAAAPAAAAPAAAAPAAAAPVAAAPAAAPAPASTLTVVEAAIATSIENRTPVGAAETFPTGTEKLFCYSKIEGAMSGTEIVHRWKKGNEVMANVTLKLGGSPWRTNSSKFLGEDAIGMWSVEILEGEQVLKTLNFEVK